MSKVKLPRKMNYLDPNFPESAYFACLYIPSPETILFHPHESIFLNLDEASKEIKLIHRDLKKRRNYLEVPDRCSLVQIQKQKLIPLKPEYWENPNMEYKYFDRIALFLEMLGSPDFHSLVVTPRFYIEKKDKWVFTACLPVRNTVTDATIEQFMLTSHEPVEVKAKYAAIYTITQHYTFNWRTKELMVKENSKISTPKN